MGMYDGLEVVTAPSAAPAASSMYDGLTAVKDTYQPREASGLSESLQAGWQNSVVGLAWRRKLPDLVMNPETSKWWERAAAGISGIAPDIIPVMMPAAAAGYAAGGAAGGAMAGTPGAAVGSVLGSGAAMMGVEDGLRESLIQAYKSGEVRTPEEWWNIVREVATATAKGAATGAVTFGAGGIAARTVGKAIAPSIGTAMTVGAATKAIGSADVAAQIAAMTFMPAAFQGRLPTLQEFMDGAIVVGGLKIAHSGATSLANIYMRTGKTPIEVVADARENPEIAEDITNPSSGFVPSKLDKLIAEAELLGRGGLDEPTKSLVRDAAKEGYVPPAPPPDIADFVPHKLGGLLAEAEILGKGGLDIPSRTLVRDVAREGYIPPEVEQGATRLHWLVQRATTDFQIEYAPNIKNIIREIKDSGPLQTVLTATTAKLKEFNDKAEGTPDTTVTTPEGKPIVIQGKRKQFLTDAERNARTILSERVALLESELKAATERDAAKTTGLERIYNDVRQQFTDAGRPGEADALAAVERARYEVLGRQFNKDPWELYSGGETRPRLTIRGEGAQESVAEVKVEPASAKYSPEIEAELADAKMDHESRVAFYKRNNFDNPEQMGKNIKGAGMQYAAKVRQITGELTAKEHAAKISREAGNYIGKPVMVDGKPATVTANPFGRVSVQFEDGAKKTVDADQVKLRQDNRGAYTPTSNLIEIFKTADASTGIHELGHSWLSEMNAYAARPDAPESLKADWKILRRELAIPEKGEIGTAAHEQFARSVERYFAEGKAPSAELQSVFSKFKEWLLAIYKELVNLNVEVSPEMRGVLDRMLATEEQIAAARELGVPRAYVDLAKANEARKIVPGLKDEQLAIEPFAEELLPGPGSGPTNDSRVNTESISGPIQLKLAVQRVAEIDQENIQARRGGTSGVKSWEAADAEAELLIKNTLGGDVRYGDLFPADARTPHDVQQRAVFKVMLSFAKRSLELRDQILESGEGATNEAQLKYLESIVRMRMAHTEFLGLRAEAARAQNQLRQMTETSTEVDRLVQRLFQSPAADEAALVKARLDEIMLRHFSGKRALDIAKLHKELGNSLKQHIEFAGDVTKASTWEMLVEGWKSGLLSGPVTHTTNLFGTGAFQVFRPVVDALASGIGVMRGAKVGMGESDRASAMESIAGLTSYLGATLDGIKVGYHAFKVDELTQKTESHREAIPGLPGEIIRIPLRLMAAEDAMVSTMYERKELRQLSMRQAFDEGMNPVTREFAERMDYLMDHPTDAMKAQAQDAATRMTFNAPLGEKGVALQLFVHKWNLQWMIPFVRTPINILKELGRMSPGAPLVAEWRADIAKGGVARDRAIAEIMLGSGIMAVTMAYAFDGTLTGAGSPDPAKNKAKVGVWQPYSILFGDKYYEYARIQPTGTLMGLASDLANVWDHLTPEESDKIPKMLAIAFSNAVTNQTFLQGIVNFMHAATEPDRFAPRFFQQMAGSIVPNIIAQPIGMSDPYVREINSILDAVKARLPGRQDLPAKIDWLGQPVQTKERLGVIAPVRVQEISDDKVRQEAARLDIGVADAPKKLHIGKGTGKIGDVKLEPEERQLWSTTGGQLAHTIMTGIVNQPNWDVLPDMIKKRIYQKVLTRAHGAGAMAALSLEKRAAYAQEIASKMQDAMQPEEVE